MKDRELSMRYAKALFELAEREKTELKLESELRMFAGGVRAEKELANFFQSPMIRLEEKEKILKKFGEISVIPLSELAVQFLVLVISKNRFYLLESMLSAYHEILNESRHFEEVVITSARPLSTALKSSLEKILQKRIGEKIISELRTDSNLLGGVSVRIRNRLFDGSVRTKLDDLRKQMQAA